MASLGAFTPLGVKIRSAGSFGPCLCISRDDYLVCGGHGAARTSVVEDMVFAELVRRRGLPVTSLGGKGTISFRMYPNGFRDLVMGWSRTLAAGAGGTPILPRALTSAWLTGATSAIIVLALGVAALAGSGLDPRGSSSFCFGLAAVGLYLVYAVQAWWMMRRIGSFGPLSALFFPVPLAFFHGVFARSVWLERVRGTVNWRGRQVDVLSDRRGR